MVTLMSNNTIPHEMDVSVNVTPCPTGFCGNVSDPHPVLREFVSKLNTYSLPTLVILGTVCNCLAIAVFSGPYLRRLGVNVYLSALAASDTCYLFTVFIMWLAYVDVQVIHKNGWCQFVIFLSYTSSFLSTWFVVAVNVERYIAICLPLKREVMGSPRRARLVVLALSVSAALLFSCTLFINKVRPLEDPDLRDHLVCAPLVQYAHLHTAVTVFDTVATMIIPFLALVILNCRIAWAIAHHTSERRSLSCSSTTSATKSLSDAEEAARRFSQYSQRKTSRDNRTQASSDQSARGTRILLIPFNSRAAARQPDNERDGSLKSRESPGTAFSTDGSDQSSDSHAQRPRNGKRPGNDCRDVATSLYARAQIQVTKMLLWVTSIYLILILPSYVMRVRVFILEFLPDDSIITAEDRRQMELLSLVQHVSQLPFYISFVINFFLYNLCNVKFRRALACMIRDLGRGRLSN